MMINIIRIAWASVLAMVLMPALASAQDVVVYYHTDAIGSVRAVTDDTGAVIARYDYLPFGERWDPQPSPDVRQFAGKERDAETGLDYFGARYLRPQSGRFISVDPVMDVAQATSEPQLWNRYAYVTNNPFRYRDPDGRQREVLDQDIRALLAKQITVEQYNARIQARGAGAAIGSVLAAGPIVWRAALGCFLSPSCQASAVGALEGAAGGAPTSSVRARSSGELGKVIGWGTGQTAADVAQTLQLTRELTPARVAAIAKQGVTRDWVQEQLQLYQKAFESGGAKHNNAQLLPRIELMKKLLENWPE